MEGPLGGRPGHRPGGSGLTDSPSDPEDEELPEDESDEDPTDPELEPVGTKRRTPAGQPTTDLILSCHRGSNAEVFPQILKLYVPEGSTVADTTFGRGVFWKLVSLDLYTLWKSDLQEGIDARALPYITGSVDAVVFDPPYMHTSSTERSRTYDAMAFENYYQLNRPEAVAGAPKYHEAVLALYLDAAREALRVLRPQGIYIVKCQDEVCTNRQRLTHVELVNAYEKMGFLVEDLFVVMRANKPGVSRIVKQVHSRKNCSYFVIVRAPRSDRTVTG